MSSAGLKQRQSGEGRVVGFSVVYEVRSPCPRRTPFNPSGHKAKLGASPSGAEFSQFPVGVLLV